MNPLVIGGGLAGIALSATLRRHHISHDLIEPNALFSGTRASSGILNPVMGQKRQLVTDYEVLMKACIETYSYLEQLLGISVFRPVKILEGLHGLQAQDLFRKKSECYPQFLRLDEKGDSLSGILKSGEAVPAGITSQAFQLDAPKLQAHYLDLLRREGRFIADFFDPSGVKTEKNFFHYQGRRYSHLLYCNGKNFLQIPESAALPLSVNKGQALVLAMDGNLSRDFIYKLDKKLTICPWGDAYWWAGASFEWTYETEMPTTDYQMELEKRLRELLQLPFRVVEHLSGFRVSAGDRRAVAGWLSNDSRIGALNALGTKGVLQAPRAAEEIAEKLFFPNDVKGLFSFSRF